MEQTFDVDDLLAQDQLLFGIDEVRGEGSVHYADTPARNQQYQSFSSDAGHYAYLSTSPDFFLYQPQSFNSIGSPTHGQAWAGHSAFEPQQHSFISNVSAFSSPIQSDISWNSPAALHFPLDHSLSHPVDIPTQSANNSFGFLSPTSTNDTSYFSNSSWNSSITSMSRTTSVAESVASYDTAIEEQAESAAEVMPLGRDMPGSSSFSIIELRPNIHSNRLTPAGTAGGKRPRGRRGPLDEASRKRTALMRHVKACESCRARKAKCDPGYLCRQCIGYFKNNLVHHPCRGHQLEDIAEGLLKGHTFPRKRNLGTDFGVPFRVLANRDFTVFLTIGFGEPLEWPAQVVLPYNHNKFSTELLHQHVIYNWPNPLDLSYQRTVQQQWTFPALLKDTRDLKGALDRHLTKLVDDPANFLGFPRFMSQLVVLDDIHDFYMTIEDMQAKRLLRQAFKLLTLIHIGGDISVSNSLESRRILDTFFSPNVHERDVVPCYIRSQLGDVFSKLALEYMKDLLANLQVECLEKSCSKFPLVVCTFTVLLMAMESAQYKTCRDDFHSAQDGPEIVGESAAAACSAGEEETNGIAVLLEFYKNCFGSCHVERLLSTVDVHQFRTKPVAGAPYRYGDEVVTRLREAIHRALPYLSEKSKEPLVTNVVDVTVFFDRLVAKLLLLEERGLYVDG